MACALTLTSPIAKGDLARAGECHSTSRLQSTLQNVFGFSQFRHGQRDATLAVLHGRDTFVCMSTGAGKSLCMFLPPLAASNSSMGVIISPLNSLMDEQVTLCDYMYMYM